MTGSKYVSVVFIVDFEQITMVSDTSQLTFTCLKWTVETQEKGVKYVQS